MKKGPSRHRATKAIPVYRDIYERLRTEILSGGLAANKRLPSSRVLAKQLNVARGTIEMTYQMLAGAGYTISKGARGTVVNPALPRDGKPVAIVTAARKARAQAEQRQIPPTPLLFQMGLSSLDAFPRKQWSQTAVTVTRQFDLEQLVHPRDAMGYEPLRHAIASYLRIARSVSCTVDQVLVTAGFQGALSLIAQTLLKPDDAVWLEDPGYFFARALLLQSPVRLVGVKVDREGIDVSAGIALARKARLALVTPTHQFPLGTTLSAARRGALREWADREKAWIVEDDYDSAFHHRGIAPPPIKSGDRSGRVIYAGSFSKVLFPGLRLGYLVVPPALVDRFAHVAQASHPAPALPIQKIVAAFMEQGHFVRHLGRMRVLYSERRNALAEALAAALPRHLNIALTDGGMHFVARLRGKARDTEIVERLRAKGIGPTALSRCAFKTTGLNGLLIGYTNVPKNEAGAAAERMSAALR